MRLYVCAQLVTDDGTPYWSYLYEEVAIPEDAKPPEDMMLEFGQRLLDRIDEGKAAIGEQIRVTASNSEEQRP